MKLITAVVVAMLSLPALAQTKNKDTVREVNWTIACADTEHVIDFLKEYNERPVLTGSMGRAERMAMLINNETGTWTLIGYTEQGACIMASGENVQRLDHTIRNRR